MPELADLGLIHSGRGYAPYPVTHWGATGGRAGARATRRAGRASSTRVVPGGTGRPARVLRAMAGGGTGGTPIHIGEFGCYNQTPNADALRWFADLLELFREFGWGFALWQFEGPFGIVGHGREGARFEPRDGYLVDVELLDLLLAARRDGLVRVRARAQPASQARLSRAADDRRRAAGACAPPVHRQIQRSGMKTKIAAVLVLGAVGVGAIWVAMGGLTANAASPTAYLTATATVGDVTDDVAATGTIEAAARYGLVFGADPYLVTDTRDRAAGHGDVPGDQGGRRGRRHGQEGPAAGHGQHGATSSASWRRRATACQSARRRPATPRTPTRSDADDSGNADQIRQAKIGQLNAPRTRSPTPASRSPT